MNECKLLGLVMAMAGTLLSGAAHAALFDRGGGMVYDDVLNITWLQDANYAKTSGYDADGLMTWAQAKTWAANLAYGGYDDWRLPTGLTRDGNGLCLGSCTESEMAELFYTEGGLTAGQSILASATLTNYFKNIQPTAYWTGTAYPVPNIALEFWFNVGFGMFQDQSVLSYAWAVRSGDVAAPIPEPETYTMLLAGLGLLGAVARRRKS